MNADGSGQRNLSREWGLELAPWNYFVRSPDWKKIAFQQGGRVDRGFPVYGRPSPSSGLARADFFSGGAGATPQRI